MAFQTLDDVSLAGVRALVRVDFNVPMADGAVTDDTRLRAAVPTIALLRKAGARIVLLSHLGRPKGAPDPKYTLEAVLPALRSVLPGVDVGFCRTTDDDAAIAATSALADGAVLLMENTRFLAGEETNDDALRAAAEGPLKGVLAVTDEALVSIDFNHVAASSTVALAQTQVIDGGLGRILSWYDNEWGFSSRMSDTAMAMARLI